MARVRMKVDGVTYEDEVDPRLLLVHHLRDGLGRVGTPVGCDTSNCGSCTLHVDGESVKSCSVLAVQADGCEVTTIQGIAEGNGVESWHPVQRAFIAADAFQCGYCTPGQIMSAVACIREGHARSAAEVREFMAGNLCRCGAYPHIVDAVLAAAGELATNEKVAA